MSASELSCLEAGVDFQPLAFETSSGISPSSLPFLKTLLTRCSDVSFCPRSVTFRQFFQQTSVTINKINASMIVSRLPTNSFSDLRKSSPYETVSNLTAQLIAPIHSTSSVEVLGNEAPSSNFTMSSISSVTPPPLVHNHAHDKSLSSVVSATPLGPSAAMAPSASTPVLSGNLLVCGQAGPGSFNISASSVMSGFGMASDRNVVSSSPGSPHVSGSPPPGSVFQLAEYTRQTADSNHLDAGGSPTDNQNVVYSGPGQSMPPALEMTSLTSAINPLPPLSMMTTRSGPPFSPSLSNFMPPLMPGMLRPSGARPGATSPMTA